MMTHQNHQTASVTQNELHAPGFWGAEIHPNVTLMSLEDGETWSERYDMVITLMSCAKTEWTTRTGQVCYGVGVGGCSGTTEGCVGGRLLCSLWLSQIPAVCKRRLWTPCSAAERGTCGAPLSVVLLLLQRFVREREAGWFSFGVFRGSIFLNSQNRNFRPLVYYLGPLKIFCVCVCVPKTGMRTPLHEVILKPKHQ